MTTVRTMRTEVRDRWLAALRSGEYAQGKTYLGFQLPDARRSSYCCLGVLCELAVADGVIERQEDSRGGVDRIVHGYAGRTSLLPDEVVVWAGLTSANPTVRAVADDGEPARTSLAWLNDHGRSFDVIATLIEEQL